MREARHLGKSAALVTPDRALARRVMAALSRWNLGYNDSGGDALMETSAGIFARLAAEAVAKGLEPPTLLALLKHPLCRLGRAPGAFTGALETLELAVLRGTRPQPGSGGLGRDVARFRDELAKLRSGEASSLHPSEPRARLAADALDRAEALVAGLRTALAPLENLSSSKPYDFAELAARHREVLIELSRDEAGVALAFEDTRGHRRWRRPSTNCSASAQRCGLMVALPDYPDLFQTAFGDRAVRRPERPGAQLHIYGPLESRLMQADRVIIGGLIEGVWPPAPRIDPWLSRPMRHELGLDLPERRIGLSAHDFTQLLGTGDVILSHAAKAGGAPAVASRFLHRLEAVAGDDALERGDARGARPMSAMPKRWTSPPRSTPIPQPAPKPPRAARPLKLSVTAIEDWLRDPYTIYAKHILRLDPLDPVDMPLSAADRGSAIHDADRRVHRKLSPPSCRPIRSRVLREIGEKYFAPLMERPEARALWWPRFQRIAVWFAEWEGARRGDIDADRGRNPRRDRRFPSTTNAASCCRRAPTASSAATTARYAILDYKTGTAADRQAGADGAVAAADAGGGDPARGRL